MLEGPTAGGAHAWAPFLHHENSLNFHDVKRSAEDAQLARKEFASKLFITYQRREDFPWTEVYDL